MITKEIERELVEMAYLYLQNPLHREIPLFNSNASTDCMVDDFCRRVVLVRDDDERFHQVTFAEMRQILEKLMVERFNYNAA